jgi:hypothetical protein
VQRWPIVGSEIEVYGCTGEERRQGRGRTVPPSSRRPVVIDGLGGALLTAPSSCKIWMVLTPIADIVRDRQATSNMVYRSRDSGQSQRTVMRLRRLPGAV